MGYRKGSHTKYRLTVHLVWITKYRKPVLYGIYAEELRREIRKVCKGLEIEIIKGHISKDHVHMLVSYPVGISVSKMMQRIKGKSSYRLLGKYKEIAKKFWGRHLWGRGYFAASSGNVTEEVIAKYIEEQEIEERKDDNFEIG